MICLFIAAVACFLIGFKGCSKDKTDPDSGFVMDDNAVEGGWNKVDEDKVRENLNASVEEGYINISMNTTPVFENGLTVTNYAMDGYVLSIPYPALIGTSLTIGVKNGDGTLSVRTYQLLYNSETGYSAYSVYGRNDIFETLMRPFKLIKKLLTLIIEKISPRD